MNALCVTVCDLSRFAITPVHGHAFKVPPQSFPHLWKKLWKIAGFGADTRFRPGFLRFPEGAKPWEGVKMGFAGLALNADAEYRGFRQGEALAQALFPKK